MWKCPECEKEITKLHYEVSTNSTEWGTAYLNDEPSEETLLNRVHHRIIDEHSCEDNGDTDWNDDASYQCSECEISITIDDLIWENPEEIKEPEKKKKKDPEEHEHKIITPKNPITTNQESISHLQKSTVICQHCFYIFATGTESYGDDETFINCPKCGKQNEIKVFKELLETGFFNNKKHYVRK